MHPITEDFIRSIAPDAASVANGRGLVDKNKFAKLAMDPEETLLFGECTGSGKKPYIVSADFIDPASPVFRCSCPSRKFPCKHAIGLLFAKALGKPFSAEPAPEDVLEKRKKLQVKAEKKEQTAEDPAQTTLTPAQQAKKDAAQATARKKKVQSQLQGLDIAEKALFAVIRDGFGAMTPKIAADLEKQAKQLGNHYLPGVQTALRGLLALFSKNSEQNTEEVYSAAFERAVQLHFLIKKGKEYLEQKEDNPVFDKDTTLEIEAFLGHAWQLTDLETLGMCEENATLMQLAFTCRQNEAALAYEDTGVWLNLASGKISRTLNIRPFRASKHIAQDDSIFGVLETSCLYTYPGGMNPRIRWNASTLRQADAADYTKLVAHARTDYAELVKAVKNQLKNPLAESAPLALIAFEAMGKVGAQPVLRTPDGSLIPLADARTDGWPDTLHVLKMLGSAAGTYHAALLRFSWEPASDTITAAPLALVKETGVFRLAF